MQRLKYKHILLGVSGGIAAYKAADLCSQLTRAGAKVRVVMTAAATAFVSALTFQALSGHQVYRELFTDDAPAGMSHIELARWADVILIAPTSANTLAKLAHGRADNLLTTLCLASSAIKCFAPAMNRVMWEDPATQHNCQRLLDAGWHQFGPDHGHQACGEVGAGRMLAVTGLLDQLSQCFAGDGLHGLHVLVTAGPTHEAIDPVRYIANRSSGRMGYAMAEAAQAAGAKVSLLSGPVHLPEPVVDKIIQVETAAAMQQAVMAAIENADIYISAAAVADYRVATVSAQKIKKHTESLTLSLVKNPDILRQVAALPQRPYVVGFAAETQNLQQQAMAKLVDKKLDMIIANDVSAPADDREPAAGFNSDYNAVQVYWRSSKTGDVSQQAFTLERKTLLARKLIDHISRVFHAQQSGGTDGKK